MPDSRPAIRFDHESVRVFAPASKPTVYYVYAWDHQLLYKGASLEPRRRLHEHLRVAEWAKEAAFVELEYFRNPTAMAKAELAAEPGEFNVEKGKRNGAWGKLRVV